MARPRLPGSVIGRSRIVKHLRNSRRTCDGEHEREGVVGRPSHREQPTQRAACSPCVCTGGRSASRWSGRGGELPVEWAAEVGALRHRFALNVYLKMPSQSPMLRPSAAAILAPQQAVSRSEGEMGTQRFRYAIAADVVGDSDWAIYRAELRALYRIRRRAVGARGTGYFRSRR